MQRPSLPRTEPTNQQKKKQTANGVKLETATEQKETRANQNPQTNKKRNPTNTQNQAHERTDTRTCHDTKRPKPKPRGIQEQRRSTENNRPWTVVQTRSYETNMCRRYLLLNRGVAARVSLAAMSYRRQEEEKKRKSRRSNAPLSASRCFLMMEAGRGFRNG